jgi:hypothetical protein
MNQRSICDAALGFSRREIFKLYESPARASEREQKESD